MPSSACYYATLDFHSFPTRRSSDLLLFFGVFDLPPATLAVPVEEAGEASLARLYKSRAEGFGGEVQLDLLRLLVDERLVLEREIPRDRKSTRLNSSHMSISYAVFCLLLCYPRFPFFPYTTLFRSPAVFRGL